MALNLSELTDLRAHAEWSLLAKRADGAQWRRAWRQRQRWETRWAGAWYDFFTTRFTDVDLPRAVKAGQALWRPATRKFVKAAERPSAEELAASLALDLTAGTFAKAAGALYATLALQEGEDAGQATLDALGIHETFEWAGVRSFAQNPFNVRGSKVIQGIYGEHLKKLARLVLVKTDPSKPQAMPTLVKEIQAEWPKISRQHATTIARTESAYVWETTNWNALTLNGVEHVEWLIASGPSIGPPKSMEVCEYCLERAALSPYLTDDVEELPPLHPRCRCTVIQVWDSNWLPPAEPWTGAAHKLETFA
jgi:hypothetical protein